jgi:uncharacterized protein (DUF924 family)
MTRREQVLDFWFDPANKEFWFERSDSFDAAVGRRLAALHRQAVAGELDAWADSPKGALALCILLDQVPRNIYRGSPEAFASDPEALKVARRALESEFDSSLSAEERLFLYLPFEHSEDLADQELCCRLFGAMTENPEWLTYAERHREIIQRFGRFPHRNAVLGRPSTEEERAFLEEPNSSF